MAEKTLDQILAEVKAFANKRSVVDDANDFAKSEAAARKAAERLTPMGVAKTYGKVAKDAAVGAAIPASFLGGPVGLAAGGVLAAEGLGNAVEDPSALNVGTAALGMLPFVKPARAAMKAGSEARAAAARVGELRNTYGAGDMGAAFSRDVPYRAGSGVSSPPDSFAGLHEPETMLQKARAQVAKFLHPSDATPAPVTAARDEASVTNSLLDAADSYDNGATSAPLAHLDRQHATAVERMKASRSGGLPSFEILGDIPDVQTAVPRGADKTAEVAAALVKVPTSRARQAELVAREASVPTLQGEVVPESIQGLLGPGPTRLQLPPFGGTHITTTARRLGVGNKKSPNMLLPDKTTLELAQELGQLQGTPVKSLKAYPMPSGDNELMKALRQRAKIAARPRK